MYLWFRNINQIMQVHEINNAVTKTCQPEHQQESMRDRGVSVQRSLSITHAMFTSGNKEHVLSVEGMSLLIEDCGVSLSQAVANGLCRNSLVVKPTHSNVFINLNDYLEA